MQKLKLSSIEATKVKKKYLIPEACVGVNVTAVTAYYYGEQL